MKQIAVIGECMVELGLSNQSDTARLGFGGDTLNTAIYLSRCLPDGFAQTSYVTALGDDPFAQDMLVAWRQENLDTSNVRLVSGKTTGLYAISLDETGERSFYYWRESSPARDVLSGKAGLALCDVLSKLDGLYFTGITLAILREEGRDRLLSLAEEFRANGKLVAYDPNHRPQLWADSDASAINRRAFAAASLALPSRDEVATLLGVPEETCLDVLPKVCTGEIVLRRGGPCVDVFNGKSWRAASLPHAPSVVDTTAAGDSFNGAYLAFRLAGFDPMTAVQRAHAVALAVISSRGAIIQANRMPIYEMA